VTIDPFSGVHGRKFHGHRLQLLALSACGGYLFTASKDRSLKQFDLVTGECVQSFNGHTDWITCCHAAPGPMLGLPPGSIALASGSSDCTVRLWGTGTGSEIKRCLHADDTLGQVTGVKVCV